MSHHRPSQGSIDYKHLHDGTVTESAEPDISDVIDEVISHILSAAVFPFSCDRLNIMFSFPLDI